MYAIHDVLRKAATDLAMDKIAVFNIRQVLDKLKDALRVEDVEDIPDAVKQRFLEEAAELMKFDPSKGKYIVQPRKLAAHVTALLAYTAKVLSPQNPKIHEWLREVATEDIPMKEAMAIYQAFEGGADTEHSVSKVTGTDAWTCKRVLDLALKYGILKD